MSKITILLMYRGGGQMWFLLFLIFINDWFLRCRRSPLLPIFQRDLLWKQLLRIQVNTDLLLPMLRIHLIFSSPFSLPIPFSLFPYPSPFFLLSSFFSPNPMKAQNEIYTPLSLTKNCTDCMNFVSNSNLTNP